MKPDIRRADRRDVGSLVILMSEFSAEGGYPLDQGRARIAFEELLRNESFGRVWLIEREGEAIGYLVLTLGYSIEYGGRDAFVDDLFIREPYRGRGYGGAALEVLRITAESLGVRAIHLEVARDNARAQALYRRAGFVDNDRQLLTLRLSPPSHREPPLLQGPPLPSGG